MWNNLISETTRNELSHGSENQVTLHDEAASNTTDPHVMVDGSDSLASQPKSECSKQSMTSHIRVGAFDIIVRVCRPDPGSKWPDWKLRLVASDGSSFNIDSRESDAIGALQVPPSLLPEAPCRSKTAEDFTLDSRMSCILQPPIIMVHNNAPFYPSTGLSPPPIKEQGAHSEHQSAPGFRQDNKRGVSQFRTGVATSSGLLPSETDEEPSIPGAASLVRIVPSIHKHTRERTGKESGSVRSNINSTTAESSEKDSGIVSKASSGSSRRTGVDDTVVPVANEGMDDGASSIATSLKRNLSSSKITSRKASRVKYDIRWADPDFYSESQKRQLVSAQWPEKRDPVTHLPVVYCHKCYLENHRFEQCETTYPKGRWVYWRHFKCGASYIRGHVFPPRLVSQWVTYHVNKQADSSSRRSLRNASL